MSTNFYLKAVTEKGLRYIVDNSPDPEGVQAAKAELRKRGLPAIVYGHKPTSSKREMDGYEKDHLK